MLACRLDHLAGCKGAGPSVVLCRVIHKWPKENSVESADSGGSPVSGKMAALAAAAAVVLVLGGVAVVALATMAPAGTTGPRLATRSRLATTSDPATPSPIVELTAAQIAALPEARYSAVIPGLIA